MGGDKVAEKSAPVKKGKPNRVRTLTDVLNTMSDGNKTKVGKKETTVVARKKRLKVDTDREAKHDALECDKIDDNGGDSKNDGCVVATKSTVTSQNFFKGKGNIYTCLLHAFRNQISRN